MENNYKRFESEHITIVQISYDQFEVTTGNRSSTHNREYVAILFKFLALISTYDISHEEVSATITKLVDVDGD